MNRISCIVLDSIPFYLLKHCQLSTVPISRVTGLLRYTLLG